MNSTVSINKESIFEPKVYRDVLGKCGKNSCHNLYAPINFCIMDRFATGGGLGDIYFYYENSIGS